MDTTPMAVDGPPPSQTRDYYTSGEHDIMDLEVKVKLEKLPWRENASKLELSDVLEAVLEGDPRLEQNFPRLEELPDDLEPILSKAWEAMKFQSIRTLRCLQAPYAPELMVVDNDPPPPETRDYYTPPEHRRMDEEVKAKMKKVRAGWREDPSLSELFGVLRMVVESDPRLDRKYIDKKNFPDKVVPTLFAAWKAMEFRSIRILCDLQAPEIPDANLTALEEAMTHDYKGTYVDKFVRYLCLNRSAFNSIRGTYYAKFCSITQSSGTGKTRLLFELGKKVIVLYINIRSEMDTGYPPRDTIPAKLLTEVFPTKELYSRRCRIFFATIFKCLTDFLKKSTNPFGALSNVGDERRTKFFENFENEFNKLDQEPSAYNIMCHHYKEMAGCLWQKYKNASNMVIALDEAHVLHEKTKDYLPATVLHQTIKEYSNMYKMGPDWVVFASTVSKVAHHASPQVLFPSARVALEGQLLFPPFTQLGWDQYAPVLNEVELDKVALGSHLLRYGRPLWWSLKGHRSLPYIIDLAAQKLCASRIFNPGDQHQAFAVLGQRFCLDIAFGHRHAVQYNDTLVTNHLRVCLKTTDDQTWSYTTYPSEPILSVAAAKLLYEDAENLSRALTTVSLMANGGLINIGDSGELASRFLWLLAKDCYVRDRFGWRSASPSTTDGVTDDYHVPYCQPVPVVDFLRLAFGPNIFDKAPDAQQEFDGAFVNFSHWVQMSFDITRREGRQNDVSVAEWTESLWARTSAIQCCHGQPVIDKVIPIYFKSRPRGSAMSHILISDAARDSTHLADITRTHKNIAPDYTGPPYIAILVDLGLSSSTVDVLDETKEDDPCLRIYAAALDQKTFPFLTKNITKTLQDLYKSVPSGREFLEEAENEAQFGASREARYMNLK